MVFQPNRLPVGDDEQDKRLRFILEKLPTLSDRITRTYIYEIKGSSNFDAGLINFSNNRERPAFQTFMNRVVLYDSPRGL